MRIVLAVFMAVHGVAHLVGFAGAWHLIPGGFPGRTTLLGGQLDLGTTGIRVLGFLWLVLAVAFVAAAIATVAGAVWWAPAALTIAIASLLLSVLELPEAHLGVAINIAIIMALGAGWWLGRI
jgi:hypothetical protein